MKGTVTTNGSEALLRGSELRVECVSGGEVTVEKLEEADG